MIIIIQNITIWNISGEPYNRQFFFNKILKKWNFQLLRAFSGSRLPMSHPTKFRPISSNILRVFALKWLNLRLIFRHLYRKLIIFFY